MKTLVNILGVAATAVTLTSCLKDKPVNELEYGMANYDKQTIVELPSPPNHEVTVALDYVDQAKVVDIVTVGIAADKALSEDLQVVLDTTGTTAAINAYNLANGTAVVKFPNNFYTYAGSGLNVTMSSGSRLATVQANMNAILFDPSTLYALQYTIKSVDKSGYTISGNFGKLMVFIGAKNKYDGRYTLDFCFYHPTASPTYGCATTEIEMHTISSNSCKMYWPLLGGYANPILSGTSFSYFLAQEPAFAVDPVTNKLTVTNVAAGGTIVYTTISTASGYDSRYDPATEKFYVRYGYNYSPGPVFSAATNREWTQTMTYIGPR